MRAYSVTYLLAYLLAHLLSQVEYPEPKPGAPAPCAKGAAGVSLVERDNSTTCPRVMLCDVHVAPDGRPSKPLELGSRCNLEGYGGLDYDTYGNQTRAALAAMPGGRCPYPPGDVKFYGRVP